MALGERLKDERTRLGYSQVAFAELVGASKRSQIGWEQGRSNPDGAAYEVWAKIGVDVLYVITGQRSQPVPSKPLSPRQAALLDNYEHLNEDDKKAIERTASALAQSVEQGIISRKGGK